MYRRAQILVIAVATALATGVSLAQSFSSTIPSSRWLLLSSPIWPKSPDECRALQQEFSEETAKLNAQHEECLQDAPREEPGANGCSKVSCQAVHSARDRASKAASQEVSLCNTRVNVHLAKEREEARRREQIAREQEQDDRERAQLEADRKARRDADQARQKQRDRERDSRRERERQEEEARHERDSQARAERERTKLDAQARDAREREARQAKAEQEQRLAVARAEQERARMAEQLRAEAAKKEREAGEQRTYLDLVTQMSDLKTKAELAARLVSNPFETAREVLADGVASTLVDKGLDIAAPIGAEKNDPGYNAVATAVDETRSRALANNPFAEKVSGLAMQGVNKIHRQMLGQVDELGNQIEQFGRDDHAGSDAGSQQTFRPQSAPAGSHGAGGAERNPFETQGKDQARVSADVAIAPRANPFDRGSDGAGSYQDPGSGTRYDIPAGHTLFRGAATDELSVLETRHVESATGDHWINGQLRCSPNGKGRVIPECERRRKSANPFAQK